MFFEYVITQLLIVAKDADIKKWQNWPTIDI